jgi:hypothetical protein
MLFLRWTLGVITALAACGWLALAAGGSAFRRSFGGSANAAPLTVLPVAAAAVVVASVLWPERRLLLHGAAAVVVLVAIGSTVVARETASVAAVGLLYAGAWLCFYRGVLRG